MNPESVDRLAHLLWDYHHVGHTLKQADCILVLGSHDTRVAERGADLFLEGWAPLLIFSGHLGSLTKEIWTRPEAEIFADIAVGRGVPQDRMLLETQSTNTGENARFTKALLDRKGVSPKTIIVVTKPYMERRVLATFGKVWPEPELIITSPQIAWEDYPTDEIPRERVVHIMVGDLQRIPLYAEKGYQIPQEIPPEVWQAYEQLIAAGYTGHLVE